MSPAAVRFTKIVLGQSPRPGPLAAIVAAVCVGFASYAGPASAQATTDLGRLVQRDGIYVDPVTGRPFSGRVMAVWEAGGVREQGTLLEGRWDGVHEWFHGNGQLSTRETWVRGRLDGPSEAYFKSGQLSVRETYRNGVLEGPYESYWNRGRIAERGAWSAGRPCGEWVSFGRPVTYPPCGA